jgi:hypothetical protein
MVQLPFKKDDAANGGGLFDSLSARIRRLVQWEDAMVSTDHFRHELLAQLGRAATQGHIHVLVNSGELCRTIPRGSSWSASCCDAMQAEFKVGDTLVLDRANGAGMTIRYQLPRRS